MNTDRKNASRNCIIRVSDLEDQVQDSETYLRNDERSQTDFLFLCEIENGYLFDRTRFDDC